MHPALMRFGSLSVLVLASAFPTQRVIGQTEKQDLADPKNIDLNSMTELEVQLLDENGDPVLDAAVMPYAMRMRGENGHGYWNREKLGTPSYLSNEQGIATIRYPAQVYAQPEPMTTELVSFQVTHSDFVTKTVHQSLGDVEQPLKRATVSLKKGCELSLTAQDEAGRTIKDFAVLIAGPVAPDLWASLDGGGRRTSSLNEGTWQTMLVLPQKNGPTLFSGVLPLRVGPRQAMSIRNVKMSPGTHLTGRLSKNVPRPVKMGRAITLSVPKPSGDSWGEQDPSLTWSDWTEVQEDGSFEIESLPRSGKLQVIVVCEGWLSTTDVEEASGMTMGQLFDAGEDTTNIVVEMEPTAAIALTILDQEGKPLRNGVVSSWPNQKYFKGGTTLLGSCYRSLTIVENQLTPIEDRRTIALGREDLPYLDVPVENGRAKIFGLPRNSTQNLVLQHDELKLASPGEDYVQVQLGDVAEKEVTLFAVPHTVQVNAELLQQLERGKNQPKDAVPQLLDTNKSEEPPEPKD